jgi:branched-chain amino acid transport system substrate-binding protein
MRHARVLSAIGAVAVALSVAACASSTGSGSGGGTTQVVIGFPDDLTGINAFAGIEQARAAELAVKKLNSEGGKYQFSLKEVDTKSTTAGAVAAVRQLTSDRSVKAIAGIAQTQSALAAMPAIVQSKLPSIMLQVTELTGRGPNVFSMAPSNVPVQQNMVNLLAEPARKVTKLAIIWTQEPTTQSIQESLVKDVAGTGISIVANEGVATTATDVSPQVSRVMKANPDAVAIEGKPVPAGTMAAQLRSAGFKGLLFGQQGIANASFLKTAGDAANGVMFTAFWDPSIANQQAKDFIQSFKKANPTLPTPDVFALQAWDAVNMIGTATRSAGTDASALTKAISSTTFDTALQDKLQFGPDGFAKLNGHIIQFGANGATQEVH